MTEVRLCRNGLHPMVTENISVTTDGAERCRACRRDQARKRKERDEAEGAALMDLREVEVSSHPAADFELPFGTLGRKWIADGKCTADKMDPRWFFSPLIENEASAYCEGCPVINLCFSFGVIGGEFGVWGGTTESQREMLTLSQRLTIRQSYAKMYSDYLGDKADPVERVSEAPAAMPYIPEWREATIMRGIQAAEYESVAGVAGYDKNRFGRRPTEALDGFQP